MTSADNDFSQLLQKSKEILLVIPPLATDDAICAAFGLSHYLKNQQKNVSLLLDQALPERLNFLEKPKKILENLSGSRDFVLVFNTKHNKITNLRCTEENEQYIIRITPQSGTIDPRDFSFVPADFKYDLVIIINAKNLDSLAEIYYKNTDLFFEVPKVNIDNQSANENFGQVNLVNMTASSVSEVLAEHMTAKGEKFVDKNVAQALLSGIIAATESFQRPCTTPNSMIMSAKLMKHKADQPTIIRHLYKTKSLSFLKLWGRVMARLNFNQEKRLVWSLLSIEDFVQSRSSQKDIPYILEQIHENFCEARIFAIFYNETADKAIVRLRFANEKIAQDVANLFDLVPNQKQLVINYEEMNILEAEKDFLEKMEGLE